MSEKAVLPHRQLIDAWHLQRLTFSLWTHKAKPLWTGQINSTANMLYSYLYKINMCQRAAYWILCSSSTYLIIGNAVHRLFFGVTPPFFFKVQPIVFKVLRHILNLFVSWFTGYEGFVETFTIHWALPEALPSLLKCMSLINGQTRGLCLNIWSAWWISVVFHDRCNYVSGMWRTTF